MELQWSLPGSPLQAIRMQELDLSSTTQTTEAHEQMVAAVARAEADSASRAEAEREMANLSASLRQKEAALRCEPEHARVSCEWMVVGEAGESSREATRLADVAV